MEILQNVDVQPLNTFGLAAHARYFVELDDVARLPELCRQPQFERETVLWLEIGRAHV